jgi:hypothetical protein
MTVVTSSTTQKVLELKYESYINGHHTSATIDRQEKQYSGKP